MGEHASIQDWAREMARYTRWQNRALYALCDGLTRSDLHADRGLFFGSIFATLDHILVIDRALLQFIITSKPPPPALLETAAGQANFAVLAEHRKRFDERLVFRLDRAVGTWLDSEVAFHSERLGRRRAFPRYFLLMQMFNHATHHRSQVTSELHRLGLDYGSTDLPFNPDSLY